VHLHIRDRLAGLAPLPKAAFLFVWFLILYPLVVWLMGEEIRWYAAPLTALFFAAFMYWRISRHER